MTENSNCLLLEINRISNKMNEKTHEKVQLFHLQESTLGHAQIKCCVIRLQDSSLRPRFMLLLCSKSYTFLRKFFIIVFQGFRI